MTKYQKTWITRTLALGLFSTGFNTNHPPIPHPPLGESAWLAIVAAASKNLRRAAASAAMRVEGVSINISDTRALPAVPRPRQGCKARCGNRGNCVDHKGKLCNSSAPSCGVPSVWKTQRITSTAVFFFLQT